MAKSTGARRRVDLVIACALLGFVACQDGAIVADSGGVFETLSNRFAVVDQIDQVHQVPVAPVFDTRPVAPPTVRLGSEDGAAVLTAQAIAEAKPPPPPPPPRPPLVIPTGPAQWFNPRGQHEGTEGIVADLAKLGVTDNAPLYINECWGRPWGASTSDHHQSQHRSWACDLSVANVQVPTPQTHEAARRIGSALGQPGWTGGNLVKTINGYRIQVLWMVAGHYNHVHIGVRKV